MRCGPIRHTAARPVGAPHDLEVAPRTWFTRIDVPTTAADRKRSANDTLASPIAVC
jgi:hypothetical protein